VDKAAEIERYKQLAERVRPLVVESVSFLHGRLADGKKVLVRQK
jgi:adenylosuccinate synthase